MSKIQESIRKAREKSLQSEAAGRESNLNTPRRSKKPGNDTPSGFFRLLKTAQPNKDVMEQSRFVSEIEDSSAIAAYKVLRTRVLQRMRSNNWRSLLVTSTAPGEGKTLTSSNLALSLSRDVNHSVMLVDLDLQRSKVAEYFGFDVEIKHGIGDYLNGKAEIPDIVYAPSGLERLSIIPNREAMEHSSDLLSTPRMKDLTAWIRGQSEQAIVIFDMPPISASDDVLAFCPAVDAVLYVVAEGQTDRTSLQKAMALLGDANILGLVLNKSGELADTSAYGYY